MAYEKRKNYMAKNGLISCPLWFVDRSKSSIPWSAL
jgi:hypothetical protein